MRTLPLSQDVISHPTMRTAVLARRCIEQIFGGGSDGGPVEGQYPLASPK